MAKLHHAVIIQRPVEEVFEYVTDLDNFADWQTYVTSVERQSEEPMAVGSSWRVSGQAMGRIATIDIVVTALEPDRLLRFRITGGPLEGESALYFEAVDGGTEVTLDGQASLTGMYKLFGSVFAEQAQQKWEADLETLKATLEAGD